MKKLILLTLLMFSFSMSAQQFVNYYYWGQMTKDGVKGNWFTTNVKAYFNYGNDTTKMYFDVNGSPFKMTQVGGTTKETVGGLAFQKMSMIDDATGESATVELFDDVRYGVMILFNEEGAGNALQFAP
jgi:hypothetical protein